MCTYYRRVIARNHREANQIKQWKDRLTEGMADVFEDGPKVKEPEIDVKTLHAKIGQLTLENDFLSGALGKVGLLQGAKK